MIKAEQFEDWASAWNARYRAEIHTAKRAEIRRTVRHKARALGLPYPDWCRLEPPRTKPEPKPAARVTPYLHRLCPKTLAAAESALPIELPPELVRWRQSGEGRIVQLSGERVTLHEPFARPRKYASVDAALAAVG